MVYLAELLVVMTDGLKIVRIRARNVPRVVRTRTQAPIDEDAFLAYLCRSKKATVSRARCAEVPSC